MDGQYTCLPRLTEGFLGILLQYLFEDGSKEYIRGALVFGGILLSDL